MSINKICTKFIRGTNQEVTTREMLFKHKTSGGLAATDLGVKMKIAFCKNVAQARKLLGQMKKLRGNKKREQDNILNIINYITYYIYITTNRCKKTTFKDIKKHLVT